MVILSAGICDKIGKILVSRQFGVIPKRQLQQLYYSFPKMIKPGQQHTYVESDVLVLVEPQKHRFLFTPLEGLYLVLISSKSSNIIQDQQTIKMLYSICSKVCSQGITEDNIDKNCVDIILGFDDAISMGYRQSVTLQEVEQQLKMESADEKAHNALMKQRIEDAKQAVKKQLQKNKS